MMREQPKVAVVTGTSRGLGRAIVAALTNHDYHVICGQRTIAPAPDGFSNASNVRTIPLDMLSNQGIDKFSGILLDQIPYVDLLVNNAAICPKYPEDTKNVDDHWHSVLQVNFFAHVRLTEKLLPLLQRSTRSARVVNVSSGDGELVFFADSLRVNLARLALGDSVKEVVDRTQEIHKELLGFEQRSHIHERIFNGQPAYKLSKAALNVYTQVAARHHRNGDNYGSIRFISVCPGDVDTAMADVGVETIQPARAVRRMWPALDADMPCPSGVFLRYNEQIPW